MSAPLTPLALIVARSRNGVIGAGGALPWSLPEDLKRFRNITLGHAVIMGRKTRESIGRALPGRLNIVVTSSGRTFEGSVSVTSLEAAIELAHDENDPEPFVIGGERLYRAALPLATHLFITEVDRDAEGDARFPAFDERDFAEISRTPGAGVVYRELLRKGAAKVSDLAPIVFYFDFISPYAFLAWTQIHGIARRFSRRVEPVPVLFAALLDAHGTLGPAEVPARRAYLIKDVARKAHMLGVEGLAPPPTHPFNPLLALRAASMPNEPSQRRRFIDALYDAAWRGAGGVEGEAQVRACAVRAGLDPDAVMRDATSDAAKQRLRSATGAAVAHGAFGVPTLWVDGELFFGTDSLPHLEELLAGRDPVPPGIVERWTSLPASAQRKR